MPLGLPKDIVADMRIIASLLVMLSLALSGQAMALAKGQPAAVGTMVLCLGGVTVAVPMDANGQPVSAPHLCPDCVLSVLPVPSVAAVDAPSDAFVRVGPDPQGSLTAGGAVCVTPPVRGPPVLV